MSLWTGGDPKAAMQDVRRKYAKLAKELGKRAYHLAVADYFKGKNLLTENGK